MNPQRKLATPDGYTALTVEAVGGYIAERRMLADMLGGAPAKWRVREVGDGNLNLVFIVEGQAGALCLKQALPYVRMVGESWPLPLTRAHFEYAALVEQVEYAPEYVPALYHHDAAMALTAMEYLSPHIILRKGLIQGTAYPHMARHLGTFMARVLFHTSDLYLPAALKKQKIAQFAANTAMCKISEDLIFDEPYFAAPLNRHTPALTPVVEAMRQDAALKDAAQMMKWRFLNHVEALLHGDLHTGSVMVTETETRVIDPEFAFYGPMGFDVGAMIANLLLAYFSQNGHGQASHSKSRAAYGAWILDQIPVLWQAFAKTFLALGQGRDLENPGGDGFAPRAGAGTALMTMRLAHIWEDAIGFSGCKMIRRLLGLAHVEDMESIADIAVRAVCEERALKFGRELLVNRAAYATPEALAAAAQRANMQ